MGLSFHDEKSMSETIETLHFDSGRPTSETICISQESKIDDSIGILLSDDIQIAEKS